MNGPEYLRRLYSAGRWFMVHRDLMAAFGFEQAVLLSFLINVDDLKQRERKDPSPRMRRLLEELGPGWFPCKTAKVNANLGITDRIQERIMRGLCTRGVVQRTQVGMPAIRFLKVNYDKVDAVVVSALDLQSPVDPDEVL